MFVCKNALKEKINIQQYTKDKLKQMSKARELFCPECDAQLVYCHGKIKTPYFRHKLDCSCELNLIGETEEHRKGKVLLYKLFKKLFPESYVEFEYKIQETNQRADVICIHPDGERVVFEMQCSNISPEVWEERCRLYEQANIKQYWFAGRKLVKKGEVDEGYIQYNLKGLAEEFLDHKDYLLYLDVEAEEYHLLYKYISIYSFEKGRLFPGCSITREEDIITFKDKLITKEILELFRLKTRDEKIAEREKVKKREIETRKAEQEERRKIESWEEKKTFSKKYKRFIEKADLNTIIERQMNKKEKWLFNTLMKKHNFTNENFPGICFTNVAYMHLIKTPPHLWQLWIYDMFLKDKKGNKYDKVYVPAVYEQFKKMVQKGIFRVKYTDVETSEEHFSYAIYNYFNILENIGAVTQLGVKRKYYQINIKEYPRIEDRNFNISLSNALTVCIPVDVFPIREILNYTDEEVKKWEDILTVYRRSIHQSKSDKQRSYRKIEAAPIKRMEFNSIEIEAVHKIINSDTYHLVNRLYTETEGKINKSATRILEIFKEQLESGKELNEMEKEALVRINKEWVRIRKNIVSS